MKKLILILLACFTITIISCDEPLFRGFADEALLPYDGNMTWEKVVDKARFSRRVDHSSVVFDDKMWVLGGYDSTRRGNQDCYMEDVWSSSDGLTWSLVTDNALWKGRRGHATVAFNGYIYVIGGFAVDEETKERGYKNDVYRSSDGIEWTLVTDSNGWEPRMNHSVVVSGEKMYLFGGMYKGDIYFDDMWESSDGITWTEVVSGTLPGKRSSFGSAVDSNGIIYLLGGTFPDVPPSGNGDTDPESGLSDTDWRRLWSFNPDDTNPTWEMEEIPSWNTPLRAEFTLGYIDEKLLLLPGRANTSFRFSRSNNLYSLETYDFSSWSTDSIGPPIPPRYSYSSVVFPIDGVDYLYIIGGLSDNGPENDVYRGNFGGVL